jgi:hypothetical protein
MSELAHKALKNKAFLDLAEWEGFEPSVRLFNRTTV